MKVNKLISAVLASMAIAVLPCNVALAQQYAGKVITIVVNFSAGGPTDIEARLVARHLAKHVQGASNVVVRNVGGGGGNIGVNQLGESSSEADRLNLGFFTWNPVDQLVQNETLRVRYNDLKFIVGFRSVSLLYIRRDTPPGMVRSADVVKAPLVKVGALSPTEQASVRQRLALDLLGVKQETIAGYKGLRDIELAIRQGDLNVTFTSTPGWNSTVKPILADTGIVMPLFQYDRVRPDGTRGRSIDMPDVPSFTEVFKDVNGQAASPSGDRWEALELLNRLGDGMNRSVFMPPNAPPAAVEEMRAAFVKLTDDPEFIADYEKVVKVKPRILTGPQGDAVVAELGKVRPSLLSFLRKYLDTGR